MFAFKKIPLSFWRRGALVLLLLGLLVGLNSKFALADDPGTGLSDCIPGNCPSPFPNPSAPSGNYTNFDTGYSAFVGGNYTVTDGAEIEGRAAVGGNFAMNKTSGTFGVGPSGGGSLVVGTIATNYLVVAGNVSVPNHDTGNPYSSPRIVLTALNAHGNAVVGGTISPANSAIEVNTGAGDTITSGVGAANVGVDFTAILATVRGRSQCWTALAATGTVSESSGNWTLTGDGSSALQVFNITSDVSGWGWSYSNIPSNATILINVSGTTRTWDNTGMPNDSTRERVLVNFYQATSVTLGSGQSFEASLLAPNANVTLPANFNGRLIVGGNVTHNGSSNEVHNYPFTGALPACDWGDLPDSGSGTGNGNYPTATSDPGSSRMGASHKLTAGLYLGSCVDGEPNGQPNTAATLDNTTSATATNDTNFPNVYGTCSGSVDEDGVTKGTGSGSGGAWANGANGGSVNVTGTNGACLNGWIDWNNDGDFDDTNEQVISNGTTNGASQNYAFTIPSGTITGSTQTFYGRFRLTQGCSVYGYSGTGSPSATGAAANGEVEDYQFSNSPTAAALVAFNGRVRANRVVLRWTTGSELDVIGFNVWRRGANTQVFKRINSALIPAQALGTVTGARYRYVDRNAKSAKQYRYKLEIVHADGSAEWSETVHVP